MNIDELPPMERLAIEQALYSKLGEDVSTKNPDSLRAQMDEAFISSYRASVATGLSNKSNNVFVNGEKVGTYSIRENKGKDAQTVQRFEVADDAALDAWVRGEDAQPFWDGYITSHRSQFAQWYFETMGELPEGCEMAERTIPAQPTTIGGTTLRIEADKVAQALKGYLPTTFGGLLGGGADE